MTDASANKPRAVVLLSGGLDSYTAAAAIKAGALNLVHSEKYRSLDDYLIPKADWAARRDEYPFAVGFLPRPGYEVMNEHAFRRWLPWRRQPLYVLRRLGPVTE